MRDNYKLLLKTDNKNEEVDLSLATTSLLHTKSAIINNNQ